MSDVFSFLVATFISLPILGYIVIFIIAKQVTKQHRRAVHIALDWSTILFIISVHYLILTIWDKSFLWLIFVILIFIASIVVLVHWKVKQEIDFPKVFRGFWRISFLLFLIAYIVLLFYGIFKSITNAVM